MKILVIHDKEMRKVSVGVDSAVLRATEPLFLDESKNSRSLLAPAVRIGRLGFHIPESVAESYADATSVFHILKEEDSSCPFGLADRTFFPGRWEDGIKTSFNLRATIVTDRQQTLMTEFQKKIDNLPVKEAVSKLSAWSTLKTGDVILFAAEAVDIGEPVIDTEVTAFIDGKTVLDLRIK